VSYSDTKRGLSPGRWQRRAASRWPTRQRFSLDEVGDIPPAMQAITARVARRRFERVGGVEAIEVDVRVISATKPAAAPHGQAGKFREDLFYRRTSSRSICPPLRDRPEDIPCWRRHSREVLPHRGQAAAVRAGGDGGDADLSLARHIASWRTPWRGLRVSQDNLISRRNNLPAEVTSGPVGARPNFPIDLDRPLPGATARGGVAHRDAVHPQGLKKTRGHSRPLCQDCGCRGAASPQDRRVRHRQGYVQGTVKMTR